MRSARSTLRWREPAVLGATLAAAGMVAVAASPIAGASSGNGISSKSATAIVQSGINATKSANSFTIDGNFLSGSQTVTFQKVSMDSSGNAKGAILINGQRLQVLSVKGVVYINGSKSFWVAQTHDQAAGNLLGNKWVFGGPSNGGGLSEFATLLNAHSLAGQFSGQLGGGNFAKGNTSTIAGQKVIAVNGNSGNTTGTAYVATTGKSYLVRVNVKQGAKSGGITFSGYNQRVSTTAPKGAVNLQQLQSGGGSSS